MERLRIEDAAIAAEPVVRFTWMYFNAHRGEKVQPQPLEEFRVYPMPGDDAASADAGISGEAAAAVLSLVNEGCCPAYLLGAWQEVQKAAKAAPKDPPMPRLLKSDDGLVAVVAPRFVDGGIRGGLVGVAGTVSGKVVVRDHDRSLLTWQVMMPQGRVGEWIEANLLLLLAT